MAGLRSVLRTIQAKPYHPFEDRRSPLPQSPLILSLEQASSSWGENLHYATAKTQGGRNVGNVTAQGWHEGWWEIRQANVDSFRQREGIAQALYMILAEAAPRGIIPNITDSVSSDAARVWQALAPYGVMTKLEPTDDFLRRIDFSEPVDPDEDWEGITMGKFYSWDDVVSRGLDLNFSNPTPPNGYSSWQELCLASGGEWNP